MLNKNLEKYRIYDKEYFSVDGQWCFYWEYEGVEYCLGWEHNDKRWIYLNQKTSERKTFSNIYEALDKIKYHGRSLRQLLIETDFCFSTIE